MSRRWNVFIALYFFLVHDFRSHRSSRYDVLAAMFYDLLVMSLKSGSMRVHICRALPDPYIAAWPASYRTDTLACL